MTSDNLETQMQKEMMVEMDILLLDICEFNYDKAKRLNSLRKKDYDSKSYGENISPYDAR